MPNIFHQSVEDILKTASAEQKLLWNYIFLRFGERVPVAQLYYQGSLAGAEFLTYSARKLYVAYSLKLYTSSAAASGLGTAAITFYDEINNATINGKNHGVYWDATAAAIGTAFMTISEKNFYFSRLLDATGQYGRIQFIGYRIAI